MNILRCDPGVACVEDEKRATSFKKSLYESVFHVKWPVAGVNVRVCFQGKLRLVAYRDVKCHMEKVFLSLIFACPAGNAGAFQVVHIIVFSYLDIHSFGLSITDRKIELRFAVDDISLHEHAMRFAGRYLHSPLSEGTPVVDFKGDGVFGPDKTEEFHFVPDLSPGSKEKTFEVYFVEQIGDDLYLPEHGRRDFKGSGPFFLRERNGHKELDDKIMGAFSGDNDPRVTVFLIDLNVLPVELRVLIPNTFEGKIKK